jgi:hypothetical protein
LISSARSRLVKIGPLFTRKSFVRGSSTSDPRMSDGSRSMVNWMRAKARSTDLPGTTRAASWPARGPLRAAGGRRSEGDQDPLDDHVLADHHGPDPGPDGVQEVDHLVRGGVAVGRLGACVIGVRSGGVVGGGAVMMTTVGEETVTGVGK